MSQLNFPQIQVPSGAGDAATSGAAALQAGQQKQSDLARLTASLVASGGGGGSRGPTTEEQIAAGIASGGQSAGQNIRAGKAEARADERQMRAVQASAEESAFQNRVGAVTAKWGNQVKMWQDFNSREDAEAEHQVTAVVNMISEMTRSGKAVPIAALREAFGSDLDDATLYSKFANILSDAPNALASYRQGRFKANLEQYSQMADDLNAEIDRLNNQHMEKVSGIMGQKSQSLSKSGPATESRKLLDDTHLSEMERAMHPEWPATSRYLKQSPVEQRMSTENLPTGTEMSEASYNEVAQKPPIDTDVARMQTLARLGSMMMVTQQQNLLSDEQVAKVIAQVPAIFQANLSQWNSTVNMGRQLVEQVPPESTGGMGTVFQATRVVPLVEKLIIDWKFKQQDPKRRANVDLRTLVVPHLFENVVSATPNTDLSDIQDQVFGLAGMPEYTSKGQRPSLNEVNIPLMKGIADGANTFAVEVTKLLQSDPKLGSYWDSLEKKTGIRFTKEEREKATTDIIRTVSGVADSLNISVSGSPLGRILQKGNGDEIVKGLLGQMQKPSVEGLGTILQEKYDPNIDPTTGFMRAGVENPIFQIVTGNMSYDRNWDSIKPPPISWDQFSLGGFPSNTSGAGSMK